MAGNSRYHHPQNNAANAAAAVDPSGSIYCHQQLQPVPASPPVVMAPPPPPAPPSMAHLYQFLPPAYAALLAAQHQHYVQQAGVAGHDYPVASTSAGPEGSVTGGGGGSSAGSFLGENEGSNEQNLSLADMPSANQYSTVSQIEATPLTDPQTGEAIFPCPFCEKSYGGKHGRSIWRRHLSNKHGIPLHVQPRKTRWDNGESCRTSLE